MVKERACEKTKVFSYALLLLIFIFDLCSSGAQEEVLVI